MDSSGAPVSTDPRIIPDCISEASETHHITFEGNPDGTDVIKEVMVKPGDTVKKGDVLMTEDTDQSESELAILKAAMTATGAIQEQDVTINIKNQLLAMLNKAARDESASQTELLNAQLDQEVAVARKQEAEEEQQQRQLQYERQLVKIQKMTLRSPIDGVVERVNLYAGEAVDANANKDGACYIVNNNPLFVEMHIPDQYAVKLKLHDKVDVAFPYETDQWHPAEVIFLSSELDYVGQTRKVRLSLPNPDNHPAGERLTVRLPESVVASDEAALGSAKP